MRTVGTTISRANGNDANTAHGATACRDTVAQGFEQTAPGLPV